MRKTLSLYSILIYIFFFNGTVSFAETANIITTEQSEKYEDSTYNIFKQTPVIAVQDPYFVIEGDKFSFRDIFMWLIDENGNSAPFEKVKFYWINNSIDTSKVGSTAEVGYSYSYSEGDVKGSSKVIVKKDMTSIKAKDFTMYEGDPNSIKKHSFVSATDEEGNPIYWWDDPRITYNKFGQDIEKPGVYSAMLFLKGKFKMVNSEYFKITVKKDRSSISTKSSTLYIGQKWNPKDNFVTATDEEGKFVPYEDSRVTIENANEVDTSKPGIYKIKYTFKGKVKNVYSYAQVTVKKDQTKAELKDTELYVGQKWDLGSVFKYAVDKDGNPIKLEQVPWVEINGEWIDLRVNKTKELIDTSKPGKHKVKIAVVNGSDSREPWTYSNEVTVTVKEEPFTIKLVPYFDFEDHILVSTNKSVVNKKENPTIDLETPSIEGKDWQLQVELSPFLDKTNDKSILKGVSLFIPKGRLESDLATEEPTQYDCQLEANGKASILMHGTKTKGKG
ncbi:hypothetical protein J5K69_002588, partial [Enterococcus faecalis]|nr:hypothetical protein [Enterococcus faecalis]